MKNRTITAPRFALTSLALATLAFGSPAWGLGLGRLSIQSALGESLRAEIEVTSLTAEEAGSLALKLASPDVYKAGGVEYPAVLTGTRASLVQRSDGRSVIRLTSDRVVMEPFLDIILEMNWASGRLVREYTLLLDPPKTNGQAASVTPAVVTAMPAAAPAAVPAAAPAPAPSAPAQPAAAAPAARATAASKAAPKPRAAAASDYVVKPGDTLSAIASRVAPPAVSLDQMLVALFRGNPDAFLGGNMNRLRAGSVLSVPGEEAVRQVGAAEAREVIQAQSSDFGAYRQRLASGVPAAVEAPARQVTGKVQAAVQDRQQAAAPAPDKLKLTQGSAKAASAPEARVSGSAEKKAATDRAAELARNVEELKKLRAAASAPAVAAAPATAPAPAPAPAPAAPAAPAPVAAVTPSAAPPQGASVPAGAAAPVVAVPAQPPAVPPAPVAAPKAPAPAPAVEAAAGEGGLMQSILSSPLLLPGAGVLALLLGAVGLMRVRRRMRKDDETSFLESRNQPDSFFGASGGQRVDTAEAGAPSTLNSTPSSMTYSLSHLDAIGDVDPVAEADVYLAYGRDMQAEEILKEAMRVTPDRMAVRVKLLEVYSKRRDTKGFEALAVQLHSLTGGQGPDWTRAQELGRSIDPDNPLYQPGGRPTPRDATDEVIEPLSSSTQPAPHDLTPRPGAPAAAASAAGLAAAALAAAPAAAPAVPAPAAGGVDFDLGLDAGPPSIAPPAAPASGRIEPSLDDGLPDFELPEQSSFDNTRRDAAPASDSLDFNLDGLSLDVGAAAPAPAQAPVPAADASDLSAGLDFDLGSPAPVDATPLDAEALERKFELADEFRQIGDLEGARDLLTEVAAQAQGTLKAKAEQLLSRLG